jgi:type I restriction enzyme S subunit
LWFNIGASVTDRNENRPGYKKTKVGWIPEEWECIPLGGLAVVQTGLAKNRRDYKKPVSLPYLRVPNVQDGFLDLKEIKNITLEEHDVKRYLLRYEDVLFTEGGDFDKLGRGTIWKGEIDPCLHQNHVFAVRCNKSRLLPSFLSAVASGPFGKKYFVLSSKQSTNLASINSTQLKKFPIPFPPFAEQKKIAEILSTWDAAIEQTRKLIEVKKRCKKALMQQLLTGKNCLPGFATTGDREEHRFFDLPADWKCSRIREVAEECSERNTQRDKITVLSCSKHFGFVESSEYFGKQVFSENTSNYKIIRRGCFGYPSNHIEEGSIGLLLNHDIGIVSPIYTVFKCEDCMVPEYLYAL